MKKSVRLPTHINPERYKLMLRPNLADFTFEGEETIYLKIDRPSSEIELHAAELIVEKAILKLGRQKIAAKNIIYNPKKETVKFKFSSFLSAAQAELNLKFKGILNDQLRGFYRSKYLLDGQERFLVTTQFESTDARRAFPCIDEPARKAIFDVTLMIPAGSVAISNTLPTQVLEHESNLQLVQFSPTPKMSTYLLAFIVGDFEYLETKTKRGVLVRVFVTPGKKKQAEFALEVAAKVLDFYEDYFKIPYPLPVLDLIAIPDFTAGAMENWGAVTYRETALLIDPDKSSLANKQRVAAVIAHELAHQWFGNLVTMEWWTHLWLNEGFASYMEYLAVDQLFPHWDLWSQFVYLDLGRALALDGLKNTHPIEVEVHHPDEISEIFDPAVTYSKGASIIRMLADLLGYKTFRDGLRLYLKRYEFANAVTEDLWAAFEQVSGQPVGQIMRNWTSKAGYPVLEVKRKKDQLLVKQSRFFSSPISKMESHDQTLWSIPLSLATPNSKDKLKHLLQQKSLTLSQPQSSWFKLNSTESSFIRVQYQPDQLQALKQPIKDKKLTASDRLGLIRDAFDLAAAGCLSTDEALNLALSYQDDDDYTVWAEISSQLNRLANLIAFESYCPNFGRFCRQLFAPVTQRLGWQKKEGEKHTDTLLRSLALANFGKFGDKSTIKQAFKLFKAHLAGNQLEADLRGVVYNLVAENGRVKEYNQLLRLYQQEELQQERDRITRALGLFKDQSFLKKTLDLALSDEVRSQDSVFVLIGVWSNPVGRKLTWKFIKQHWSKIKKQHSTGHRLPRLLSAAEYFNSESEAEEVEKFFKSHPVPEAGRTVSQALEQIYANADWLKRDRAKIKKFLISY